MRLPTLYSERTDSHKKRVAKEKSDRKLIMDIAKSRNFRKPMTDRPAQRATDQPAAEKTCTEIDGIFHALRLHQLLPRHADSCQERKFALTYDTVHNAGVEQIEKRKYENEHCQHTHC